MKRCFFISSYEISLNELCTSIKIKSPSWTILTSKNKHASSGLRFEHCSCLYDGHWKLTWSLTLGSMELIEMHVT